MPEVQRTHVADNVRYAERVDLASALLLFSALLIVLRVKTSSFFVVGMLAGGRVGEISTCDAAQCDGAKT